MGAQGTFAYTARTTSGELINGQMLADSIDEVGARIRGEGKYVIAIRENALTDEAPVDSDAILRSEASRRVQRDDVIAFAQQVSIMLETGVPLSEALASFTRQTGNQHFRRILEVVTEEICSGTTFSAAIMRWPRIFPTIMVSLLKASEASGTMSTMLSRVGSYLSKERRTVKQIRGALSYPIFMLVTGIAISVFLVAAVLPRFASIYETRSATLPLPTKILMDLSHFVTTQYTLYVPLLVAVSVLFLIWRRTIAGRRTLDWLRLNTPVIGHLYRQLYITRATRTMSTLLAAGVGFLDVISICRGVTNNHYWNLVWDRLEAGIRDGKPVSELVRGCDVIPPNVASMIAAGERAGRLSEVTERIAEFSDEELDNAVRQATAFIEPLMICGMGIVIGLIALALLLPIFTIGSVM